MSRPARAEEVGQIVESIRPLLAGHPPAVQSAVLADLLAMWLAGHFDMSKKTTTKNLRKQLLADHLKLVRQLIPVNEAWLLERARKGSH